MSAKLGIFIIHGMGSHGIGYAENLIAELNGRLGHRQPEVAFESCYWAPLLQQSQDLVWSRLQRNGNLDSKKVRKWVVSALGDPVCYLSGYFKSGRPIYGLIHECMRKSLATLRGRLGNDDTRPLMIVAHSLGSVIVSNYIWDESHGNGIGNNPFERTDSLVSLVTYGSNIPLFVPPVSPLECVRFPSPQLPARYRDAAAWKNVFDPDDILGYPLNDIWDVSNGTVIQDIDINASYWPISETPLAHTKYDTDNDFLDVVSGEIEKILGIP